MAAGASVTALCAVGRKLCDYDFDRSTLRFYDKDGNDITAEYDLSGGGIQ